MVCRKIAACCAASFRRSCPAAIASGSVTQRMTKSFALTCDHDSSSTDWIDETGTDVFCATACKRSCTRAARSSAVYPPIAVLISMIVRPSMCTAAGSSSAAGTLTAFAGAALCACFLSAVPSPTAIPTKAVTTAIRSRMQLSAPKKIGGIPPWRNTPHPTLYIYSRSTVIDFVVHSDGLRAYKPLLDCHSEGLQPRGTRFSQPVYVRQSLFCSPPASSNWQLGTGNQLLTDSPESPAHSSAESAARYADKSSRTPPPPPPTTRSASSARTTSLPRCTEAWSAIQ